MRRRLDEFLENDSAGNERWLVSYSDLITLMFAFFVVMYSVSSVNEGKYRVLSDTLVDAFRAETDRPLPIDLGGGMPSGEGVIDGGAGAVGDVQAARILNQLEEAGLSDAATPLPEVERPERFEDPKAAASYLKSRLAPLIEDDTVRIREGADWVEIELDSEFLFASGSADLTRGADTPLSVVAETVASLEAGLPVRIEGHTDDRPIGTERYPSNWELSAARAARVVRVLNDKGIDPARMSAVGLGEFQPLADNDNPAGRRKNRRVVVAVAAAEGVGTDADTTSPVGPEALRTPSAPLVLERVTRLPGPAGIP